MFFFVVAKSKKNIDMLYMRKTISYFLCSIRKFEYK